MHVSKPTRWLMDDSLMILEHDDNVAGNHPLTINTDYQSTPTNNQHPCRNSGLLSDRFFSRSYV